MIRRLLQSLSDKYNYWVYHGWTPHDPVVERRAEHNIRNAYRMMFMRGRPSNDTE
jgi:hypothetical protein